MFNWLFNLFRRGPWLCIVTVTPADGVLLHFAGAGPTRHEAYHEAMRRRGGLEPVTNVRFIPDKE